MVRVGIVGKGNVGKALGRGLERAGHEVKYGHRDSAEPVDRACSWADVVILAVPFAEVRNAVNEARGALDNKVVIDVTNPTDAEGNLAVGWTTSAAEELQKYALRARVVKAFNTVFAEHMTNGRLFGTPLATFIASDHEDAKQNAILLARDLGFQPVDAGPLRNARYIEPAGLLNIQLGYGQGYGTGVGLTLATAPELAPKLAPSLPP